MSVPDSLECDTGDREVPAEAARRTGTFGDLDPTKWQTLCSPHCSNRLWTVFVGNE